MTHTVEYHDRGLYITATIACEASGVDGEHCWVESVELELDLTENTPDSTLEFVEDWGLLPIKSYLPTILRTHERAIRDEAWERFKCRDARPC